MHIAGGFYREQCCIPEWDALFGSGGRAATTISTFSPGSILHSFAEDFDSEGIATLIKMGIEIRLKPRPTAIVFSYFHPLSKPHIQPPPDEIKSQPSIKCSGDAVLRFGFLEGDVIVDARRAVYDPQSWQNPAPFAGNGSRAKKLAIVLNELELRSITGLNDLSLAASQLIKHQKAEVIVAKGGVKGAKVFERGGRTTSVPAYRSSRVFKIGTGDVFSAIFAHFWAEKRLQAVDAANIASKAVAAYCSFGRLPLSDDQIQNQLPIKPISSGFILLEGQIDTIGQRYTMEEARYVLRELGMDVFCPVLGDFSNSKAKVALVITEGINDEAARHIYDKVAGMPIVVLQDGRSQIVDIFNERANVIISDDFVSALYLASWALVEQVD